MKLHPGWTSLDDEMPPLGEKVLVVGDYDARTDAWRSSALGEWRGAQSPWATHWVSVAPPPCGIQIRAEITPPPEERCDMDETECDPIDPGDAYSEWASERRFRAEAAKAAMEAILVSGRDPTHGVGVRTIGIAEEAVLLADLLIAELEKPTQRSHNHGKKESCEKEAGKETGRET